MSFYEYKCQICNRNYLFRSFLEIFAYSFTSKIVFVFWFQVVGQLDGGCGLTVQGHDDLLTSSIETHWMPQTIIHPLTCQSKSPCFKDHTKCVWPWNTFKWNNIPHYNDVKWTTHILQSHPRHQSVWTVTKKQNYDETENSISQYKVPRKLICWQNKKPAPSTPIPKR